MMNPLKLAAAIGLAALTVAPAAAAPLSTWYGAFQWEESLGRIGGDVPARDGLAAFVTYRLALGPGTGSTGCTLSVEGFQRYEHLLCTATPEMESVVIKFYKFRPGEPGDRYRLGDPLLRLTRTEDGVVTRMQALSPSSDASPVTGRLFRRVR